VSSHRTTRTVDLVTRYAMRAGLAPHTSLTSGGPGRPTYRGTLVMILNGRGESSPLGTVTIGARTGRVLRATLSYGNNGPTWTYAGGMQVLAALRALAAGRRSDVGTPCPCRWCRTRRAPMPAA
jgi:hypothetical protein